MIENIERPYAGGLNLLAEDFGINPTTVPDAVNLNFTAGGRVITRGGSNAYSVAFPALSLPTVDRTMYVIREDVTDMANPSYLVVTGGNVYRLGLSATSTPASLTPTSTLTLISSLSTLAAPPLERPIGVGFVDTTAAPTKYTVLALGGSSAPIAVQVGAATATQVTHADWSAVNGYPTTCAAYGGRMWYAGVRASPSRLYVTDLGSFGTFTTGTSSTNGFTLDMQLMDGGRIIGLKHLYDMLLVFTTRGIYRIIDTGATTGVPYKAVHVSRLVAVSQHAVIEAENMLYVLAASGVHRMSTAVTYGDTKFEEVSIPVEPLFDSCAPWELSGVFSVYEPADRRVLFFLQHNFIGMARPIMVANEFNYTNIGTATTPYPPSVSTALVYDIRAKNWSYYNWPYYIDHAVGQERLPNGASILGFSRKLPNAAASTTNLYVYEMLIDGLATDALPTGANTPVSAYMRTRKIAYDLLGRRKARVFVNSYVKSGSVGVRASFDDGAFVDVDTALPIGKSRRAVIGSGSILQFEYYGSGAWELDAASPDVKIVGRR